MTYANAMNDMAYTNHCINLDSVVTFAQLAAGMSVLDGSTSQYIEGYAEALNNLAFADIKHLDFNRAQERLDSIIALTNNQIEQLIAYVQKMQIDRMTSENRGFYANKEKADACRRRISEELDMLSPRQQQRYIYAESEYHLTCAQYYNVLGQKEKAQLQLQSIDPNGDIRRDTAQYLKYLCMTDALAMTDVRNLTETSNHFNSLVSVLATAREHDYIYITSLAMLNIGEYLITNDRLHYLKTTNAAAITYVNAGEVDDEYLAGWLTEAAASNFSRYGDIYMQSDAYRQLAVCCHELGNYDIALEYLDRATFTSGDKIGSLNGNNKKIKLVPSLMADIHEQYSVAFAALDNKPQSDWHRNMFLDLREITRQDRYNESRAEQLDTLSLQLNLMVSLLLAALLLLVLLLCLFSYLSKRAERADSIAPIMQAFTEWCKTSNVEKTALSDQREEMKERLGEIQCRITKSEEYNIEARAKMQMVNGIMPLIDRMKHEIRMLAERYETDAQRMDRYQYITELANEINRCNDTLTQWIEVRKGQLRLRIETFALQSLFDIVNRSRSSFAIKGIELNIVPTNVVVRADKVLTLFMLNTLTDNARRFTPTGGTITINADICDSLDGNYTEISVTDTGCGLTDIEKRTIFIRQIDKGRGFGLLNCRSIIQSYHKVSRMFASCILDVESEEGKGSRFFFRLPVGKGARTAVLGIIFATISSTLMSGTLQTYNKLHCAPMEHARRYADSAYYSNIAATYERTLMFSDSCRHYLNIHNSHNTKGSHAPMLRSDNGEPTAPEIQWLRDSVDTDYNVILDIRNETAVAALALHEWQLYRYNNDIYTRLFQELSTDNTIGAYCHTIERQQTNKNVMIGILLLLLIMIIPAYYFLYYRKRLRVKREALKVKMLEIESIKKQENQEKQHIRHDIDMLADECEAADYELAGLHIANNVLDNCLSTIKHETMYYPNRILQVATSGSKDNQTVSVTQLRDLVDYYRDIYAMLASQAQSQISKSALHIRRMSLTEILPQAPENIFIIADRNIMHYLFRILNKSVNPKPQKKSYRIRLRGRDSVVITMTGCFTDKTGYMLCRQILREHGEATSHRACGITHDNNEITITIKGNALSDIPQQT